MRRLSAFNTIVGCVLLMILARPLTLAATESTKVRSVWDGVYSEDQAARGEEVFHRECAACHSDKHGESAGDGSVPSLIGEEFGFRWNDSSVAYLVDTIRQTMPEAAPNSLSSKEYVLVTAYIFKLNGYPAGAAELDYMNRANLEQIFIQER